MVKQIRFNIKVGFTLAEVLITLGIIGVVAVITLPSVVTKYQEKATVTKLKSVYSILDQGFQQMVTDNGTVDTWGNDNDSRLKKLEKLLPKYFQVTKSCTSDDTFGACSQTYYKSRFDADFYNTYARADKYFLKNGATLYAMPSNGGCYQTKDLSKDVLGRPGYNLGSYASDCSYIYVDINGEKAPNIMDKDFFRFVVVTDGIIPAGSPKEGVWTNRFEDQCLGKHVYTSGSATCTAWVIYNENMDYLHCDYLSWNGKTKCK